MSTTDEQARNPESEDESRGTAGHALLGGIKSPIRERSSARTGGIDWLIFGVTGVIALAFIIFGFTAPTQLSDASGNALTWVMDTTGWLFVLLATAFVLFALFLAGSRYGSIVLGSDSERPEFRTVSWIAMMFSAGMGIGLMFFGVAEPLGFFVNPPPDTGVEGQSTEAAQVALATTMFHWSFHPWAIYAVVGIAIAYGTFRKGRRQLISEVFRPLLGRRIEGPIGKVIDMLAIFATLFGSAASLGVGALQIKAGVEANNWVDSMSSWTLVLLIVVLTGCFILSAVSGVANGIQILSNINMVLALLLAVFLFVVGPTVFILDLLPTMIGSYLDNLPHMISRTNASGNAALHEWLASWTIFYWAWWISWTPFVGMFIARISRGRTIREFVTGVLLAPSAVSLVWFAVFGGTAIKAQEQYKDLAEKTADGFTVNSDTALFQVLEHFPWAAVTSTLVMILVAIFFVSGADAASIIMGSLSERGTIEPSRPTVIFWGVLTGAVAAVMLLAGYAQGDASLALDSLQNIVIVSALPFVLVMSMLCISLMKELRADPMMQRGYLGQELVSRAVIQGVETYGHDGFAVVTEPERTAEADPSGLEPDGTTGRPDPDEHTRDERRDAQD